MAKSGERASYISYDEAIKIILSQRWISIDSEEVAVPGSIGKISVTDVYCGRNVPEYNRSAVDGYATRAEITANASERKPVKIWSHSPGSERQNAVVHVSTGETIPENTDSVIMFEDTVKVGEDIFALRSLRPWENISLIGEDLKRDSLIIRAGSRIEPENLAAAHACRINRIRVYRPFLLAVLSTGDEIVSGRVPNYTQPLILSYFSMPFLKTLDAGVVEDTREDIMDRVIRNLETCDALVVTGGSGPGTHDLVREILGSIGTTLFCGVKIKPGRTVSAFNVRGKFVLSVSGLPVAALVSVEAFLWPFLELVIGYRKKRVIVMARVDGKVNADPGIKSYVKVKLKCSDEGYTCSPLRISGSGILSTLLESSGTLTIEEGSEGINSGETVKVELNGV
ncbi:MAG: molybdopterin molybdotransferase MoeA [Thermoplasmataceae archaeon]